MLSQQQNYKIPYMNPKAQAPRWKAKTGIYEALPKALLRGCGM